jgi:predicted RNA binding protein YcfA (HicA-like mRNA interferase family)
LVRELELAGYIVNKTNGSHLKVTHPTRPGTVFMGATPSDNRSWKNARSTLRRTFGKKE